MDALPFINALEDPIIMGIFFATEILTMYNKLRVDVFSPLVVENITARDVRANREQNKCYPGLQTFKYKDRTIPSYVSKSPKGSVSSEIITGMLQHLDEHCKFDWTTISGLFGYDSRLGLNFLQYIINPETKWTVSLGVSYGTGFWQVGESSQINGSMNIACYDRKSAIAKEKHRLEIRKKCLRTNIILLINYFIKYGFSNVTNNYTAIAAHGLCPLNRILLDHP